MSDRRHERVARPWLPAAIGLPVVAVVGIGVNALRWSHAGMCGERVGIGACTTPMALTSAGALVTTAVVLAGGLLVLRRGSRSTALIAGAGALAGVLVALVLGTPVRSGWTNGCDQRIGRAPRVSLLDRGPFVESELPIFDDEPLILQSSCVGSGDGGRGAPWFPVPEAPFR